MGDCWEGPLCRDNFATPVLMTGLIETVAFYTRSALGGAAFSFRVQFKFLKTSLARRAAKNRAS